MVHTIYMHMDVNGYSRPTLIKFTVDADDGICIEGVHVSGRIDVPHFSSKGEYVGNYPEAVNVLKILGDDELRHLEGEIRTALALRSFDDAYDTAA